MAEEASGIALARAYWRDVVAPLLDEAAPGWPRAAGRLGCGSDVLGLDDEMSRDHDWGLRLQVVVAPGVREPVVAALEKGVPTTYAGLPTRLTFSGQAAPALTVDVLTIDDLVASRLGFDPRTDPATTDWLSVTGQAVLEITAGEVFEDSDGRLTALREALAWYPDDLWAHLVSCDWRRLDQELPLMQRAGDRGDDLGSRVIAARLVGVAMHLGFLLCRRWAPYAKWRGTLFRSLPLGDDIATTLTDVLSAGDWRSRGQYLVEALEALARAQERVGLASASPACVPFFDRPYHHVTPVLTGVMTPAANGSVRVDLPPGLGSIEQRTDNVDLLMDVGRRRAATGCPG